MYLPKVDDNHSTFALGVNEVNSETNHKLAIARRLGELTREFTQTILFAQSDNQIRMVTSFLKDQAGEEIDTLPVLVETARLVLAQEKVRRRTIGSEADVLRTLHGLPIIYSEQAKQIGRSFARGFYGLAENSEPPSKQSARQRESLVQAPTVWKINKAATWIIAALSAVTSGSLIIHFAREYRNGVARIDKMQKESISERNHNSTNDQDTISAERRPSATVAKTKETRPTIPYGMQYEKARKILGEKGWYPFKPKGLWSSGIYIDPDIVQTSSTSYQKFLLDQRLESASWFYNRNMREVVDCHPQASQCTMLFIGSNGEEALVTTNTGREDSGTPIIEQVTFREVREW